MFKCSCLSPSPCMRLWRRDLLVINTFGYVGMSMPLLLSVHIIEYLVVRANGSTLPLPYTFIKYQNKHRFIHPHQRPVCLLCPDGAYIVSAVWLFLLDRRARDVRACLHRRRAGAPPALFPTVPSLHKYRSFIHNLVSLHAYSTRNLRITPYTPQHHTMLRNPC